ncbi:MAG: hypothetical protein SP1CHLAM54_05920 [Chlamydiia bacterium]|nr:hypothetical protein [Chlamydiia bacterium]MCH9615502.1 hypothetical protein [Chlamydiia bacterium]MCH9629157.1 hypothetical protein [Chlamydiia bacterium]
MLGAMFRRFFISCAIFFSLGPVVHKATDGFAVVNIEKAPFEHCATAPPLTKDALARLDQPFTYFAKGGQCYVFLGADQKTILKVFKFQHMRVPPLFDHAFMLKKKRARKHAVFLEAIESTALSMRDLVKETALIGVHLGHSTDVPDQLTLIDKIGVKHQVKAHSLYFMLQERAEPLKPSIELANAAMDLIENLSKKGIVDKDPSFALNFGLFNGQVVQFDVGRFVDEGGGLKQHEVAKLYESIEHYFADNAPELLGELRGNIKKRLEKFNFS